MAHLNLDTVGDEPTFTITKDGRDFEIVVDMPLVTVAMLLHQSDALAAGSIDTPTFDKLTRSLYSLFHRRTPDVTQEWIEDTFSASEANKIITFLSSQIRQGNAQAGEQTDDAATETRIPPPPRSERRAHGARSAQASTPLTTTT